MMKGKTKCKILKEIRQKIANENDVPYVTRECTYQGDCKGTCPKCEAELRYLEQELEKRRSLGKTVAVAAVAAGLSLSLSACKPGSTGGNAGTNDPSQSLGSEAAVEDVLPGEIAEESTFSVPGPEYKGLIVASTEESEPPMETQGMELLGDVVVLPDESVDATQPDASAETSERGAEP